MRLLAYSMLISTIVIPEEESQNFTFPEFVNILAISLKIIADDIADLKTIIHEKLSKLEVSSEFQDEVYDYDDSISEFILAEMTKHKIYRQALDLFEDQETTERWLATPKSKLENHTPLEAIITISGAKKVEEILYQAEYGMIA